uniref:GPN-loop GTPase 3 n=1 Tax=Fibrocapsa japonica TaxID=94617 RepID=A0A7S2XYS1_9STRA
MGPAGSGKSTYCNAIQEHCDNSKRSVHVVNLDPAAEEFAYRVSFDIKDLISVDDVMEELGYGPNGALVYCMEYLLENMDWLRDELDEYGDDEYIIFDCPGQVELYSHIPVMRDVVDRLKMWDYNVCGVFLVDSLVVGDPMKLLSGTLISLSAMVQLELPHVNVLTKCDLVDKEILDNFFEEISVRQAVHNSQAVGGGTLLRRNQKLARLTDAICSVVDDFTMVSFVPLDLRDEDSIGLVLAHADHVIQYGEDLEPKEPKDDFDNDYDPDNNVGQGT